MLLGFNPTVWISVHGSVDVPARFRTEDRLGTTPVSSQATRVPQNYYAGGWRVRRSFPPPPPPPPPPPHHHHHTTTISTFMRVTTLSSSRSSRSFSQTILGSIFSRGDNPSRGGKVLTVAATSCAGNGRWGRAGGTQRGEARIKGSVTGGGGSCGGRWWWRRVWVSSDRQNHAAYIAQGPGEMGVGGCGGGYSFVACLGHLIVRHASLSRRSTVPIPNRDTSNMWALIAGIAWWRRGYPPTNRNRLHVALSGW